MKLILCILLFSCSTVAAFEMNNEIKITIEVV